jgi:hypothetical protein
MYMEAQIVEIPKRKVDILRAMQPGESIEVTKSNRYVWYNLAKATVGHAKWQTITIDGKVYLHRVS